VLDGIVFLNHLHGGFGSMKVHLGLLSFGAFLIVVAVWTAALAYGVIATENLVPLVILSSGVWVVFVAGLKLTLSKEAGAFRTFGWGMLFAVLGGAMYMMNQGMNAVYTVVLVLLLIGALAVVAALRASRQ
jgi:hypothetical protein